MPWRSKLSPQAPVRELPRLICGDCKVRTARVRLVLETVPYDSVVHYRDRAPEWRPGDRYWLELCEVCLRQRAATDETVAGLVKALDGQYPDQE